MTAPAGGPGGPGGHPPRPPQNDEAAEAAAFRVADAAGALDLLLASAALGTSRLLRPDAAALHLALQLARRPQTVALRAGSLAAELAKVATGASQITPGKRDRRFSDPAWSQNPLLRRLVQAYLAAGQTAEALLSDAELSWRDSERMKFLSLNVTAAASPSNNPLINPAALRELRQTGGLSVLRGARALLADLAAQPRVPTMVAPDAFEVGKDLAVTPGAVVARSDVCELIQYEPATPVVHRFPLLIVPPMINKFYITDLAPGRSMVEYLVGQGQQVFVLSWRNPDARHRHWGMDSYGSAVEMALDAVREICAAPKASICALCSGGVISSMVAAQLSATGRLGELASLCLGVTVLDQARAGTAAAMIDERTAEAAVLASAQRGYLDGRALAEVFAWLRPDDLIWTYWVNNYLQGKTPPPFDILYWNADTTRLPAALHRDFIRLALTNGLTRPAEAVMLGSPVDLAAVTTDSYVVAGIADHLCPWQSCYASTVLLGGRSRFVLSTSGHIASMVNPPSNPKATFQTAPDSADNPADPREWLAAAQTVRGSWWPDYASWLAERSGGEKKRPATLGGSGFCADGRAPGSYVLDR
jgi:polyhydroxyalkanoate synthase subunit PhaC